MLGGVHWGIEVERRNLRWGGGTYRTVLWTESQPTPLLLPAASPSLPLLLPFLASWTRMGLALSRVPDLFLWNWKYPCHACCRVL